jgi:uncharacterized protein YozE (UPF0346 family)
MMINGEPCAPRGACTVREGVGTAGLPHAAEFLQLYPSANILVATKKDFETKNRKKFCARIATGDYDAVIIGHSQFEKIPISVERQKRLLEEQIDEITNGIRELKEERGERFAIKQLEKTKKTLKLKLDKLNDTSRKDDVVTFEELGVDRLFVDEADFYKNLFLYTKMRNVAGLSQAEAQKSSDLFMKCRYLDELTEGRGIIFATGTPISNSITEMYTMQRYLQYETLRKNGLQHFDCWASTFGETVTAIELAPEGTGYRAKTRFARFYNLPELMNMFKEIADIKTADMLNLPVPKANYCNIAVKPSEFQQDMVAELAVRAERVRAKEVEPYEDNMLKITNDGRKLALDQRLANSVLPDHEESKVNACVENVFRIWQENSDDKLTQLVFCDLSTPKNDGNFNVYKLLSGSQEPVICPLCNTDITTVFKTLMMEYENYFSKEFESFQNELQTQISCIKSIIEYLSERRENQLYNIFEKYTFLIKYEKDKLKIEEILITSILDELKKIEALLETKKTKVDIVEDYNFEKIETLVDEYNKKVNEYNSIKNLIMTYLESSADYTRGLSIMMMAHLISIFKNVRRLTMNLIGCRRRMMISILSAFTKNKGCVVSVDFRG